MEIRLLLPVALLLIMTPGFAVAQPAPVPPHPDVGLGFGPFSVEPVGLGVPVYSVGDQLWVESFENTSATFLTLTPPSGTSSWTLLLSPGELVRLRTFAPSDPLGTWMLEAESLGTGTTKILNLTLTGTPPPLDPGFVGANVSGNELQLGYTLPPTSAYNIQECTMGASGGASTGFQLPGAVGGTLRVDLVGSEATVTSPGAFGTFTGWLELYTQRTYTKGEALISEETLAARMSGVFILNGTSAGQVAQLNPDLNLREGRYDLRAYVRSPSGLYSYDAPYLMLNGSSWISLNGCTEVASVSSGSITMTTNLDSSNATWPRLLYTMYTEDGVDGVTSSRIPASEVRIDIRNSATSEPVPGIEIKAEGAGVQSWSGFNSGVYLIGASYPLHVRVTLGFDRVVSESFNVTVPGPLEYVSMTVEAGTLVVHTSANGKPLANATVGVSPGTGGQASFVPDSEGNVTLTLPPGDYNVTASFSGRTGAGEGQVLPGGESYVRIDLSAEGSPIVAGLLAVVLMIGAGADFLVWRAYLKRRSA